MLSLIVGGAASGKSAYAESLARSLDGQKVYVATMMPWDDECRRRIARHRARRAKDGYHTLECFHDLATLEVPANANVLLDCLGNLLANEMYASADDVAAHADGAISAVVEGVRHLGAASAHLTVVTNEVCLAGTCYEGDTLPYLRSLGLANRMVAAEADFVCEVVAGLPNVLKGVKPCTCSRR